MPALVAPWSIRLVRPCGGDLDLVHRWMLAPHVAHFWRQAWSRVRWADEIAAQLAGEHSRPCLVHRAGGPIAYLEMYRVGGEPLARCYSAEAHDVGLHIAIGELAHVGRGIGSALLRTVAQALLTADHRCARVVAEPGIANVASIRAFCRAGFRPAGEIGLANKTAALLVFPRSDQDMVSAAQTRA